MAVGRVIGAAEVEVALNSSVAGRKACHNVTADARAASRLSGEWLRYCGLGDPGRRWRLERIAVGRELGLSRPGGSG